MKEFENYEMKVIKDDGLYRHLIFLKSGSMQGLFSITTWPGYLCYHGDMGCYTFSRLDDMIAFFAGENNPGYWSEKIKSGFHDKKEVYLEYDAEGFKEEILEHISGREDLIEDLSDYYLECEYEAVSWVRENIDDFPWSSMSGYRYTSHYLFCCRALGWACQSYLDSKK